MLRILLTLMLLIVALVVATFLYFWWSSRSRRPDEPGFRYVYVNNRGRARELCAEERAYLSQKFDPFDSGRPAIFFRYEKIDKSEYQRGFIERRLLPPEIEIIKLTAEDELRTSNDPVSINQAVFEDRCPQKR